MYTSDEITTIDLGFETYDAKITVMHQLDAAFTCLIVENNSITCNERAVVSLNRNEINSLIIALHKAKMNK